MRTLFVAAAALAAAAAGAAAPSDAGAIASRRALNSARAPATCGAASFPVNYDGLECWGLVNANVSTAPECIAACCALGPAACTTWQFCPVGGSCPTPGSCWVGLVSSDCHAVPDWQGGAMSQVPTGVFNMNLSAPVPPPTPIPPMGNGTSPSGATLSVDSASFRVNGVPMLPAIGEMQFSRQPDTANWRSDLLAMKAGGLTAVGTYAFMTHHEEVNGTWVWAGDHSLRDFVTAAGEVGLLVFLRIGPWAHGECRNGGFPDWLQHSGIPLRSTDPAFLAVAAAWYAQLAAQVDGLLWSQGGPVFSIQVDNEYGGSFAYLGALKNLSIAAGIDVPFYTKTGWPAEGEPFGALLPLWGGYPSNFWSRSISPAEDSDGYGNFLFAPVASAHAGYPTLDVELGGGMTSAYHRRIQVVPDDVTAVALAALGSGSNQLGFYIYKGASHPIGVLSSLQESQVSGYPNDLPLKSYDFAAPLGEFGQPHPQYHTLRMLLLFVRDFGAWLAPMPAAFPDGQPFSTNDTTTLRWAARSDGTSGAAFINTYQRYTNMSAVADVRLNFTLAGGANFQVPAPSSPNVTIPGGVYTIWPFNLEVADTGLSLSYATAQPLCHVVTGQGATGGPANASLALFLAATPGVTAEIAITLAPGVAVTSCPPPAQCSVEGGRLFIRGIQPSRAPAATVLSPAPSSRAVSFIVLDAATDARLLYKGDLAGATRAFLADGPVLLDPAAPAALRVRSETVGPAAPFTVAILPPPASLLFNGAPVPGTPSGAFTLFSVPAPALAVSVTATLVRPAGPARVVPIGPAGVAQAPDADGSTNAFAAAQVWNLTLTAAGGAPPPPSLLPRLDIRYTGDAARIYTANGTTILADNFYNGVPFTWGLARYGADLWGPDGTATVQLFVLPLSADAPIYLHVWPAFPPGQPTVLSLDGIDVLQQSDAVFTASA
jgi:beta-galactosidase